MCSITALTPVPDEVTAVTESGFYRINSRLRQA
jgi:hypothetical protein